MKVSLNDPQVDAIARILVEAGVSTAALAIPRIDKCFAQRLDKNFVWNSLFFLVGICHDTRKVEGLVRGSYLRGWDYLLARWLELMEQSPEELALARLGEVDGDTLGAWYSDTGKPADSRLDRREERAFLLRDAARRLRVKWDGRVYRICEWNDGWLWKNGGQGIVPSMQEFVAYSDPLHKKTWLLMDILRVDTEWEPRDPWRIGLPVDYHLERLALRTGMVTVPDEWALRLREGHRVLLDDDLDLRRAIERVGRSLGTYLNVNLAQLDRVLWSVARECCLGASPVCVSGDPGPMRMIVQRYSLKFSDPCPFVKACLGATNAAFRSLLESNVDTFYY